MHEEPNNTANKTTSGSCLGQKSWQVEDCTFVSNKAETVNGSAGGVFTCVATPTNNRTNTFVRCHFLYNKTATSGAAIRAGVNCPLRLEGCTFVGNGITGNSGQTTVSASGDVTMIGCMATGNNDQKSGAWLGAFLLGARAYVSGCTFTNHTHFGNYGTLRVGANSLVANTRVCNSIVTESGGNPGWGALVLDGVDSTVRNCLFSGNYYKQKTSGAIVLNSTGACIENCTFVNNKSGPPADGAASGVAIFAGSGKNPTIVNCLFSKNTDMNSKQTMPQISALVDKTKVDYCWADSDELTVSDGMHNLPVGDGLPAFSGKFPGEYRAGAKTKGRDQGLWLAWMAGSKDLNGKDRVIGSGVDFGCDEYQPSGLGVLLLLR